MNFDVREALAIFFDRYYKGDSSVIMGEISRQLMLHGYEMVFSYRKLEKDEPKDEVLIGGINYTKLDPCMSYVSKSFCKIVDWLDLFGCSEI